YETVPIDYNEDNEIDLTSISKPFINYNELDEDGLLSNISKLDEGHFGFILKAYWTKTHSNVTCKALTNLADINGNYYATFIHELTMHTRSDLCENIVRFL
ncbi:14722_t:CDS:2, partial [Dentiscutata erythropus]